MTTTIPNDKIIEAIYEAEVGWDDEPAEMIRTNYSGRSMYGENCFGLVLANEAQLLQIFVELALKDEDLARDLSRNVRSDNMGRSMIYYFPGYELELDDALQGSD